MGLTNMTLLLIYTLMCNARLLFQRVIKFGKLDFWDQNTLATRITFWGAAL